MGLCGTIGSQGGVERRGGIFTFTTTVERRLCLLLVVVVFGDHEALPPLSFVSPLAYGGFAPEERKLEEEQILIDDDGILALQPNG